jgi:ATP-binding cassette subfamily C protein CydC
MSIQATATPPPALRPAKRSKVPWRLAILLALVATASGILLTGVSAWFLGAVALAGLGPAALTFNFHTPAAFVRLFALTKTVGKYGERIVGHRAALLDQVKRGAGLFAAMAQAPSARAAGWQLGNQDRLSDYIEDVEDVDFARLRVGMPTLALMAGIAALAAATAWLAPLALLPIGALSAATLMTLYWAMPRLSGQWASVRSSQRAAGRLLGSTLAAVVPLQAERAFSSILQRAFARFREAAASSLAQRRAFALLDLLAGLAGPLAGLSVLLAAWYAGSRSDALLIPAFLAFGWLALGESAQSASRIVLGRVRERAASAGLSEWTAAADMPVWSSPSPAVLQTLVLHNVPRKAPDGRRLGEAVSLTLRAGQPTALVGASGAGKTTLLKQIAGWLGADSEGRFAGDGVALLAGGRCALSHLCLHDATILADTVRANLFAPGASDTECRQALDAVELDGRVAAAGGLDGWITQDVLSLGEAQRLNLARALLSKAPLVLLDEPVEHLDSEQGLRILQRVLGQLRDRIVVYSSNDDRAACEGVQIAL